MLFGEGLPPARAAILMRRRIVREAFRARTGHIGSSLSVADILASLFFRHPLLSAGFNFKEDQFVLSKGHAALALYSTLYLRGHITYSDLKSYCRNGSRFGTHPLPISTAFCFASGSLGLGLSYALGLALAKQMSKTPGSVYVLMSDAECNEGSIWEAALFGSHHQLRNCVAIVDVNGQQALGQTSKILNLNNLAKKWEAFGWDTYEVDGHDPSALTKLLQRTPPLSDRPTIILASTLFGKGVEFMQNQLAWHYNHLTSEQYQTAMQGLRNTP